MHIQIISSILTYVIAKAVLTFKAASVAKTAVATKTYLAANTAIATKTTLEVAGAGVTTGLVLANNVPWYPPLPLSISPEEFRVAAQALLELIKNTPQAIYGLYQRIPPCVFEWLMSIGTTCYTVSGVYEGYKTVKDISNNQNVQNNQNIPDNNNTPLFPVIVDIINNLNISREELSIRFNNLHRYLLPLMYISNYTPEQDNEDICSVCLEDYPQSIFITQCRHKFCHDCLFNYLSHEIIGNNRVPKCPNCQVNMPQSEELPINIQNFIIPNAPAPVLVQ